MDLEVHSKFRAFGSMSVQLFAIIFVMTQASWAVLVLFTPVIVLCLIIQVCHCSHLTHTYSPMLSYDSQRGVPISGGMIHQLCVSCIVASFCNALCDISFWLHGNFVQRYYIASARELARLVGIQKSPTIHHYGESIAGAATIRGFGQQQRFMATNLKLLDRYGQPLFHNFAAIEWLVFRMELLSVMVFALMLILVVTFPKSVDASEYLWYYLLKVSCIDVQLSRDEVSVMLILQENCAGMAGLAVTYGLQLNSRLSKWVWELCNLENKVIAVERIQQYSDLPSEAPLIIKENRPPKDWPLDGTVELRDLQVRFSYVRLFLN